MTVTTQQINSLITIYLKNYRTKYGSEPVNFNRFRDNFGFRGMITDLGMDRAKEVVNYYFQTDKYGHPSTYLLFNYDKINVDMTDRMEDEIKRKELREQSRLRVETWRASVK